MAYKADVSDARESPAVDILSELDALEADVVYHDPFIPQVETERRAHSSIELSDAELSASDLVVITTDHSAVDYARVCELAPRVFDTRNATRSLGDLDNVERL